MSQVKAYHWQVSGRLLHMLTDYLTIVYARILQAYTLRMCSKIDTELWESMHNEPRSTTLRP